MILSEDTSTLTTDLLMALLAHSCDPRAPRSDAEAKILYWAPWYTPLVRNRPSWMAMMSTC
eukprot:7122717-Alexandrium_andersonii.AAC.1